MTEDRILGQCKFCGSDPDCSPPYHPFRGGLTLADGWVALCGNPWCGAQISHYTYEMTVAAWNCQPLTAEMIDANEKPAIDEMNARIADRANKA